MENLWCSWVRVSRFTDMSSRTAAWGQPPVSTARMRSLGKISVGSCEGKGVEVWYGNGDGNGKWAETYAGRALFLVRNSQSSRVKMSFVTAAMEKRVRRCLQRASIRAVLPDPTGLLVVST